MRDKAKYNEYLRVYMNKRYEKRRNESISKLGGECRCGSKERLHFHHLSDKSFTLAKGSSYSDSRWNEELAKCILLCEECHREEHRQKNHGTITMYTHGKCRCEECRGCARQYNRKLRASNSTGRVALF